MPIIRGNHTFEDHYTQLPNAWLRDTRLSYKARGLLGELMTHRPGWQVSRERLAQLGPDGDSSIRSAIAELEAAGYLERRRGRRADGTLEPWEWITKDPFAPAVDFPPVDNPHVDNPPTKKNNLKKTKEREPFAQSEIERAFTEFWQSYPRRVGKSAAKKAFAKAYQVAGDVVIMGAVRFASDPNLPPAQFVPHPVTWLNQGRWDDEPLPERILSPEERKAAEAVELAARREREARQREQQQLVADAEAEQLRREREANPVERCEHGRVLVMCPKCSPILGVSPNPIVAR